MGETLREWRLVTKVQQAGDGSDNMHQQAYDDRVASNSNL